MATRAPIAVLFRRGPSKLTQLLLWNLETDEITPGQWIQGKVFVRRCDLSPDGKLLVTAISNYSAQKNKLASEEYGLETWSTSFWTAVSRPPYFTALALWFLGASYNGGGIWVDNHTLGFNNQPYADHEAKPLGSGYRRVDLNLDVSEDRAIWNQLLKSRGWTAERSSIFRRDDPASGIRFKLFRGGHIRYRESSVRKRWLWYESETWELLDSEGNIVRAFEDQPEGHVWIDVDHRERVLLAVSGRIYVWEGFPSGEPSLIADLNSNSFAECPPPEWALHWP
ncbi:MAG: hypothetical protein IT363_05810 [Methanoregulaceae archaeon]|nr:hypothetical protein [Methanoregulaceae archaeon]